MSESPPERTVAPTAPADPARPRPRAAFFDLDKTVIAKSSVLAFGRPFYRGGLINRRAVLRSAYAQFVFALSGADADQIERMRAYLTRMCAGWDVNQVREIVADTLHRIIDPIVYDEAVARIEQHRADGYDIVIVSSSGAEVVRPIGELLGADLVVATEMVEADGHYTGQIARYMYAEEKATAIRELAESHGYDLSACYAYSDSATDLPMLEQVGHPVAVNPDRGLRTAATERGWDQVSFSNAVPLRRRLSPAQHPAGSATAAILAAAAAGLVWMLTRRRTQARRTA